MQPPRPRGRVSEALLEALRDEPTERPWPLAALARSPHNPAPSEDADRQVALAVLNALEGLGLAGVDPAWAEQPCLRSLRGQLEAPFEAELRRRAADIGDSLELDADDPRATIDNLKRLASAELGPSLSTHLARHGTLDQFRQFLAWKSPYQLKEADPHTCAIPRIDGRAKSALIEIQGDEYGNGDPEALHATLFATTMRAADLSPEPGSYLDALPPVALAADNALMLLALKPRLRGATLGHLAHLEMTSAIPMAAYARAARRLHLDEAAVRYFDEHHLVDAAHEQVALLQMVGPFVAAHPDEAREVVFGAAVAALTDAAIAAAALDAWAAGRPFVNLDAQPAVH